jgi:hypothetical protein
MDIIGFHNHGQWIFISIHTLYTYCYVYIYCYSMPPRRKAKAALVVDDQVAGSSTAVEQPIAPPAGRLPRSSQRVPRVTHTAPSPSPSPPPRKRRATPKRGRKPVAAAALPADSPAEGYATLAHQLAQLTGAVTTMHNDMVALRQQVARNPPTGPSATISSPPPDTSAGLSVGSSHALASVSANPAVVLPPTANNTLAGHTATVQHAVNLSVANAAPGEHEILVTSPDGELLGDIVDPKIKAKIWEGLYIDMHELYKASAEQQCTVELDTSGGTTIKVVPTKRDPLSIGQWRIAFDTYISIMGSSASKMTLMAPLIKYKRTVEDIHYRYKGGAWRLYDEAFRRAIALPGSSLRWGVVDWMRYNDAIHKDGAYIRMASPQSARSSHNPQSPRSSQTQSFRGQKRGGAFTNQGSGSRNGQKSPNPAHVRQQSNSQGSSDFPRGYCFTYIKGVKCPFQNCKWKHVCFHCQGQHFPSQCKK